MSEIVIHSIPGSPFGRAVLATLEEKRARSPSIRRRPHAWTSS